MVVNKKKKKETERRGEICKKMKRKNCIQAYILYIYPTWKRDPYVYIQFILNDFDSSKTCEVFEVVSSIK